MKEIKKSIRVQFSIKIKNALRKEAEKLKSTLKNLIEHNAEIMINPDHKLKLKKK